MSLKAKSCSMVLLVLILKLCNLIHEVNFIIILFKLLVVIFVKLPGILFSSLVFLIQQSNIGWDLSITSQEWRAMMSRGLTSQISGWHTGENSFLA